MNSPKRSTSCANANCRNSRRKSLICREHAETFALSIVPESCRRSGKLGRFSKRPSMRIVTLNVNGLRAAERKGFARWLARVEPWDVVCVQELKCLECDVPRSLRAPRRAHASFHPAARKGYSGVAVYAKQPHRAASGFGHAEFDPEGRYLQADFTDLSVISVYLPSGSSGEHRQASKYRFLDAFLPHLAALVGSGREVILCGDW